MKRELLDALGLGKDAADQIMSEYGKGVEAARAAEAEKNCQLQAELDSLRQAEAERQEKEAENARRISLLSLLSDAGMVSSLAREGAASRLMNQKGDPEVLLREQLPHWQKEDPFAFALFRTSPDAPRFSRPDPGTNPDGHGASLYAGGTPLYQYRHPVA